MLPAPAVLIPPPGFSTQLDEAADELMGETEGTMDAPPGLADEMGPTSGGDEGPDLELGEPPLDEAASSE
jgi:hypothetical protein